jgi:hypothetical protein
MLDNEKLPGWHHIQFDRCLWHGVAAVISEGRAAERFNRHPVSMSSRFIAFPIYDILWFRVCNT